MSLSELVSILHTAIDDGDQETYENYIWDLYDLDRTAWEHIVHEHFMVPFRPSND